MQCYGDVTVSTLQGSVGRDSMTFVNVRTTSHRNEDVRRSSLEVLSGLTTLKPLIPPRRSPRECSRTSGHLSIASGDPRRLGHIVLMFGCIPVGWLGHRQTSSSLFQTNTTRTTPSCSAVGDNYTIKTPLQVVQPCPPPTTFVMFSMCWNTMGVLRRLACACRSLHKRLAVSCTRSPPSLSRASRACWVAVFVFPPSRLPC